MEIRDSLPVDAAAIEEIYRKAFPEEDLLPLVTDLMGLDGIVLSLVAISDGTVAGHIAFTECGLAESSERIALLAPLAVDPARHRKGIGSALVRAGLERLEKVGTSRVCVLGDPAYYSRFGFAREDSVAPPYPLPEEWRGAWQSLGLRGGAQPLHGTLCVPEPWRQPALWAP